MRLKREKSIPDMPIQVSIDGGSLGFYVKPEDFKKYNKTSDINVKIDENDGFEDFDDFDEEINEEYHDKERGRRHKDNYDDNEISKQKLINGVKLTKSKAIKRYCMLKKKPNLFITLSFLTERITTEKLANKERWKCMCNFIRNIHYKYPNSWFFPIVGWTKEQGLHFHIPAYIDYDEDDNWSFYYLKEYAREKWQDQLFRCEDKNCFHIQKFIPKKFSYLTKTSKNREFRELRKKDMKCRLYSIFYKKNMSIYRTKRYVLYEYELDKLKIEIERYYKSHGIEAPSISTQFGYWSGRVSFLPRKWLIKTIEKIISERYINLLPVRKHKKTCD